MSSSFVCPTCGDTHEGMPTDHGWKLPDLVWDIPEEERSTRAKFNSDLCQFGERFFIRCVLMLHFNEQPGYYGWGVWAELSEADFYRYVEIYDKDGSAEPMVRGAIANEMPGYPSTLTLPIKVQFQGTTSRPTVHMPSNSLHPLAAQQSSGIDNRQYHAILVATGPVGGP